jgi:hypothetical protein
VALSNNFYVLRPPKKNDRSLNSLSLKTRKVQ